MASPCVVPGRWYAYTNKHAFTVVIAYVCQLGAARVFVAEIEEAQGGTLENTRVITVEGQVYVVFMVPEDSLDKVRQIGTTSERQNVKPELLKKIRVALGMPEKGAVSTVPPLLQQPHQRVIDRQRTMMTPSSHGSDSFDFQLMGHPPAENGQRRATNLLARLNPVTPQHFSMITRDELNEPQGTPEADGFSQWLESDHVPGSVRSSPATVGGAAPGPVFGPWVPSAHGAASVRSWCARGFQDPRALGVEDTASETLSEIGLKMICQAAVQYNKRIALCDYECAFLQGHFFDASEEPLLMRSPCILRDGLYGFPRDCHFIVRKSLYGFKDAPRRWQLRLEEELRAHGFRPLKSDPMLWILPDNGSSGGDAAAEVARAPQPTLDTVEQIQDEELFMFDELPRAPVEMVGCHVDDIICAADDAFLDGPIWASLCRQLKAGKVEKDEFMYCGKFIKSEVVGRRLHSIVISQSHYAAKLVEEEVPAELPEDASFDEMRGGKSVYRGVVGSLQWLQNSRPDLSFGTSVVASGLASPTVGDARRANGVIRNAVRGADSSIRISKLTGDCRIATFVDASFQNRSDRSSQQGLLVTVCDDKASKHSLVAFKSGKQRRKATSTCGAELLAVRTAVAYSMYARGFLVELGLASNASVVEVLSDSKDVCRMIRGRKRPVELNLQGDFQLLRTMKNVTVRHTGGKTNPSDCLTKENPAPAAAANLRNLCHGRAMQLDVSADAKCRGDA